MIAFPFALAAQNGDTGYPNHVVIGAFAIHQNAIDFSDDARRNGFPAKFEMNPNRNLYYVYVLTTRDREYAIGEALKLRKETKYFDTWVYSGALGDNVLPDRPGELKTADLNPETGLKIETVAVAERSAVEEKKAPTTVEVSQNDNQQSDSADGQTSVNVEDIEDDDHRIRGASAMASHPNRVTMQPLTSEDVAGKSFYFHLFRGDNNQIVEGEVDAIDFETSKKIATYAANTSVGVPLFSGKEKHISFASQVFGYRKQQREFDPVSPAEDLYLDDKGALVVPFELVRLQKGDVAIMYNVFFFKDAAVMRPESRYEVNNLLDLLIEHPSYRICIHGHTNGNASGKIIRMGETGNFFSLTGTKHGVGSAKQLSEERAMVMREFLIEKGISADRMIVKAWGGKKPIHDRHSVRANENVRVEIEILSE
ncbi:MAG TPA: OmpA family protein [Chryseosolibacter sp.]